MDFPQRKCRLYIAFFTLSSIENGKVDDEMAENIYRVNGGDLASHFARITGVRSARLYQDIEDIAVLIDCPPQMARRPAYPYKDCVQEPSVAGTATTRSE